MALSAHGVVACRIAVLRCTCPMLTPDELQSKTRRDWGDIHANTGKFQPRGRSSLGMQLHTQQSLLAFADVGSLYTAHSEPKNEREYTIGFGQIHMFVLQKARRNVPENQPTNSHPITSNSTVSHRQMYPNTLQYSNVLSSALRPANPAKYWNLPQCVLLRTS